MPAIPDHVMARLHQANEGFHRARMRLDGLDAMDKAQRRAAAAALRAAEKDLEEVTREIDTYLNAEDKTCPDAAPDEQPH